MKTFSVILLPVIALASLVGCGSSSAEDEAREWVNDYTTELFEPIWDELDITSFSARDFVTVCWREITVRSPRYGDSDYWQQTKANTLNPDYESSDIWTDEAFDEAIEALIDCLIDNVTGAEYSRLDQIGLFEELRNQ